MIPHKVRTRRNGRIYPPEKITAVGMGETSPIADNDSKEGRAQNRRVEFHLQLAPGSHVRVQKENAPSPTFEEGDPGKHHRKKKSE